MNLSVQFAHWWVRSWVGIYIDLVSLQYAATYNTVLPKQQRSWPDLRLQTNSSVAKVRTRKVRKHANYNSVKNNLHSATRLKSVQQIID